MWRWQLKPYLALRHSASAVRTAQSLQETATAAVARATAATAACRSCWNNLSLPA